MVLAGESLVGVQSSAVCHSRVDNTEVYTVEDAIATGILPHFDIFGSSDDFNDDDLVLKHFFKFRKKSKKLPSYSTRIKAPTREIDPITLCINSKETYSKPHFLSHLHHFLFRLTPF